MATRNTRSSRVPTRMNGRRRPKREVERSLNQPDYAGWTSMAMISPAVLMILRAVFFQSAGAYSATR